MGNAPLAPSTIYTCISSATYQACSKNSPALAGAKQTELIALLYQAGLRHGLATKPFSVDPAGLVSVDGDDAGSATHAGVQYTP